MSTLDAATTDDDRGVWKGLEHAWRRVSETWMTEDFNADERGLTEGYPEYLGAFDDVFETLVAARDGTLPEPQDRTAARVEGVVYEPNPELRPWTGDDAGRQAWSIAVAELLDAGSSLSEYLEARGEDELAAWPAGWPTWAAVCNDLETGLAWSSEDA